MNEYEHILVIYAHVCQKHVQISTILYKTQKLKKNTEISYHRY